MSIAHIGRREFLQRAAGGVAGGLASVSLAACDLQPLPSSTPSSTPPSPVGGHEWGLVRPAGESRVVIKEADRYHGWPTVAKAADDELVVVFSGRRRQHVDPFGQTLLVRSHDDGATWSEPEVVNNTPLDDRDAGIVILKDGTWLLTWFTSIYFAEHEADLRKSYGNAEVDTWQPYIDAITPELKAEWLGNWTRRSTDRGKTWEPRVNAVATSPHGPTELSDGRLLYVGGWETFKTTEQPVVDAMESSDQGRSWSYLGYLPFSRVNVR